MLITRKDPFNGIINTLAIDVTPSMISRWQQGELIQDVMPHLSADEREFIKTGITAKRWKEIFPDE